MRRFIHILSFLAVALLLLSVGSVAEANTIDPAVGVQGDPPGILWTGSATFTITTDTFTSNAFFIESGMITSFNVHSDTALNFTSSVAGETVTMISPSCDSVCTSTDAILSGFTITPQIILQAPTALDSTGPVNISGPFDFFITGGAGDTLTFSTPEPGTLILLGTGLGALGLRRLRRSKAAS
jgi:hypothetical protein